MDRSGACFEPRALVAVPFFVALVTISFAPLTAIAGSSGVPLDPPVDPCPWDLDGDGEVGAADLSLLLAEWGATGTTADIDGSGNVDAVDLAHILRAWGPCALIHDCNANAVEDATEILTGGATDCNLDGVPDDCQDCDGDGVGDLCAIEQQLVSDCDGDGVPDTCETDCDLNGIPDECEIGGDPTLDCNGNGLLDACEIALLDYVDCDADGVLDSCAIALGLVTDCNENGTPDVCESDCDRNGIADECDLANGAPDCNNNGILDVCEPDCDGNGVPDDCDLAADPSRDCDFNGRLDTCDIADGYAPDTDFNGIPDWCEIVPLTPWDALAFCPVDDAGTGSTAISFDTDPLAGGFFGPGSDPFTGVVQLTGIPLDPVQLGGAHLLMHRTADPFAPRDRAGGPPHSVGVTLDDLALVSTSPIIVTTGGASEAWDVEVRAAGVQSPGSLDALKVDSFGGFADLTLPVSVHITFVSRQTGAIVTTPRAFTLTATGIPWSHEPDAELDLADDPTSAFSLGVIGAPGNQAYVGFNLTSAIGDWITCIIDVIKYTVRLDIHNGLEGQSGGQAIDAGKKVSEGAITLANLNDTDGDGTVDRDDNSVVAPAVNPKGIDEVDLMRLVVNKPLVADGGKVKLEKLGGDIKLWTESTKTTEVALPLEIDVAMLPKTYWIEARATSAALRDISLKATYKKAVDQVRATGAWSTKSTVKLTRAAAGAANDFPADVQAALMMFVDSFAAVDASRFGYGAFADVGGADTRTGGRILIEFATAPAGVEALGISWDVTRRLEHRDFVMKHGTGALAADGSRDFPVQQEEPNDDGGNGDEQNTPTNQHIYSFDGPSDGLAAGEAFYVTRNNFVEYTRAQLASAAFANNNNLREGSRSSAFVPWHYVDYLVRNAAGQRVFDGSGKKPAASAPLRAGGGNGGAVVKLLPKAVNEGFTATYNLANRRWTLAGTSGDPNVVVALAAAPAGAVWTLKFGNKVEVTITQGATAFANNATFTFSVFTAKSAAGKIGEVAEGSTTIADET